MTITKQYVGPNMAAPGVYSGAREAAGPNAFQLASGDVVEDSSAKFTNRDCLYAGTPNSPLRENIVVRRFIGYDSGRHFFGCVNGRNILVEDWIAGPVGLDVLDAEPGVCTDIVMRRGTVGKAKHFLIASKGSKTATVSVTMEDVSQAPDTSLGNLMWAHANWAATPLREFTLTRVSVTVRHDISDGVRAVDKYGVAIQGGFDSKKAISALNCKLVLTDVWVNGKPITESDVLWQYTNSKGELEGTRPIIKHTPGWDPSKIAAPRMTATPSPPPPPPPPPPPVDPTVALREEITSLKSQVTTLTTAKTNLESQVDTLSTSNASLTTQLAAAVKERDERGWMLGVAEAKVAELQTKIDAAKTALA